MDYSIPKKLLPEFISAFNEYIDAMHSGFKDKKSNLQTKITKLENENKALLKKNLSG